MQIVQKKGNMKIYFAINMRRLQKKKKRCRKLKKNEYISFLTFL